MSTNRLLWVYIRRDKVKNFIMGVDYEKLDLADDLDGTVLGDSVIALGYIEKNLSKSKKIFPSVIVVSDFECRDLFAWVSTYTPEIFPLSHHARVMTLSEYNSFLFLVDSSITIGDRFSLQSLACIVFGELLHQFSDVEKLASIPISRAMTCYSMPLARFSHLYASGLMQNLIFDKISCLADWSGSDGRLLKDVFYVFDVLLSPEDHKKDPFEIIIFIVKKLFFYEVYDHHSIPFYEIINDFENPSLEKKILTFRRLLSYSTTVHGNDTENTAISFILALSAFLINKSTSHLFLLKDVCKHYPTVYVWFGLIASLYEEGSWDVEWKNSINLIQKYLKPSFDLFDCYAIDLYWAEFDWIMRMKSSRYILDQTSRFYTNGVAVEMFPGSTYQFSFSQDNSAKDDSGKDLNFLSEDVRKILIDIIDVSKKASSYISKVDRSSDKRKSNNYKNNRGSL